jgi:hypothetical protein
MVEPGRLGVHQTEAGPNLPEQPGAFPPAVATLTSLTGRRNPAGHHAPTIGILLRARGSSGCGSDSVAAIPVLPPARLTDCHHQAAQQHAHGCEQQPTDAVFHTSHSSPLPACGTGLDGGCLCPAGSYQHSRTGRCLLREPTFRPREVGPKRGFSQRVPMALRFGTRLSTDCLDQNIRLFQGTLPKAPAPADNCGAKRPGVVAPGAVRRQGHSPGHPTPLNRSASHRRA